MHDQLSGFCTQKQSFESAITYFPDFHSKFYALIYFVRKKTPKMFLVTETINRKLLICFLSFFFIMSLIFCHGLADSSMLHPCLTLNIVRMSGNEINEDVCAVQ